MRRSDGLQQLKFLLLVSFSLVSSFPIMFQPINGIGYLFFPRPAGCVSMILSLDLLITVSLWLFLYF